jgi:prolyl oligopeptidase
LNPDDFEAQQVWYESKDGTKVPMFIVRHKSTPFDGTAPCIQYGYGGFSVSINPFFSPSILTFLRRYGAVLAVPNIRGGAEFGEDWHLAGTKERKVNVFDDFIAATQYLVKNKYVAAGKVAINGGSNGGLLVAACVNRAPEGLLGAAVAEVGVLDLLKFADFTIGKAWTSDYGNPHEPKDFDFIYPISPLHNIPTDKVLPPFILLTADHDDRVVPLHSFKHAATLQHVLAKNPNPLLIRIDKKAGHGAGKGTNQRIKEAADKWGFVAQSLGLVWKDDNKLRSLL